MEEEQEEEEQENERSRIGHGRVVGHACGVDGALAGGLHLGAGGPLNSHSGPIGTSGEEKEEEHESEEQEVRGAEDEGGR